MKKITIAIILIVSAFATRAQSPVKWTFEAKKIADTLYELQIMANISEPWHIYSQYTPAGGPWPTKINFNRNPLIKMLGPIKEDGNLQRKYEEVFNVDVKYFAGTVTFVQKVKVKPNVKTNISGSIQYMVCTDKQCLPTAKTLFSISIK